MTEQENNLYESERIGMKGGVNRRVIVERVFHETEGDLKNFFRKGDKLP
jgi:hypothetical protein